MLNKLTISTPHLSIPFKIFLQDNRLRLWQAALIPAVFLLSALLGLKGDDALFKIGLALPFALIGGYLVLRWRAIGLVALVASVVVPFNGPSGINLTMVMVALLIGLWGLDWLISQERLSLLPSKSVYPLIALGGVAVTSFGFGQVKWYAFAQSAPLGAQMGSLALYILLPAAFLLVPRYVKDERWLKAMIGTLFVIGLIYCVGRITPSTKRMTIRQFELIANGSLFWLWLILHAFSQTFFNSKLQPKWRVALGAFLLLLLYVAVIRNDDWKSGWVPAVVGIAAIIGFRYLKHLIFLLPLTLVPIPIIVNQLIAADQYSYGTRVDAWLIVLEIAKVNPLFGLGFANYHWFTPLFAIRGYFVKFNSHSQYVDLYAQTGILGLLCFLWFFWQVGWIAWQLRERVPDGFPRAYVYGALGGVVGMLVAAALGDWVIPFFYNVGLSGFRACVLGWLFLGGLIALEQMYGEKLSSQT